LNLECWFLLDPPRSPRTIDLEGLKRPGTFQLVQRVSRTNEMPRRFRPPRTPLFVLTSSFPWPFVAPTRFLNGPTFPRSYRSRIPTHQEWSLPPSDSDSAPDSSDFGIFFWDTHHCHPRPNCPSPKLLHLTYLMNPGVEEPPWNTFASLIRQFFASLRPISILQHR